MYPGINAGAIITHPSNANILIAHPSNIRFQMHPPNARVSNSCPFDARSLRISNSPGIYARIIKIRFSSWALAQMNNSIQEKVSVNFKLLTANCQLLTANC